MWIVVLAIIQMVLAIWNANPVKSGKSKKVVDKRVATIVLKEKLWQPWHRQSHAWPVIKGSS